jgi:Protein of unknown function (DUF2505)
MTKELESRSVFGVSEETYWRELCLSLEFQERVYREALGCISMEVLMHEGGYEQGMRRRLRFKKPIDAPAAVTKVFGATVDLEEHSSFDAKTRVWEYRMVPAVMADRLDITGKIRLEPAASGVTQVSLNSVTCRLFAVGGIVEHFVAKSTADGVIDKLRFTERYIAEKRLG